MANAMGGFLPKISADLTKKNYNKGRTTRNKEGKLKTEIFTRFSKQAKKNTISLGNSVKNTEEPDPYELYDFVFPKGEIAKMAKLIDMIEIDDEL